MILCVAYQYQTGLLGEEWVDNMETVLKSAMENVGYISDTAACERWETAVSLKLYPPSFFMKI